MMNNDDIKDKDKNVEKKNKGSEKTESGFERTPRSQWDRGRENTFIELMANLSEAIAEEVSEALTEAFSELHGELEGLSEGLTSFGAARLGVVNTDSPVRISGAMTAEEINTTADIRVSGSLKVAGDVVCSKYVVSGSAKVNGNLTVNGDISVSGSTKIGGSVQTTGAIKISGGAKIAGDLKTSGSKIRVSGGLNVGGEISCPGVVKVSGGLAAARIIADEIKVSGKLNVSEVIAREVVIYSGKSTIGSIESMDVRIEPSSEIDTEIGGLVGELLKALIGKNAIERHVKPRGVTIEEDVIAEKIYLEGVIVMGDVYGKRVTIGPGTVVDGTVYYTESIDIDETSDIDSKKKVDELPPYRSDIFTRR